MRVITLGSSGAVGGNVLASLQSMPEISTITALVRKPLRDAATDKLFQHIVDVLSPASYAQHCKNHATRWPCRRTLLHCLLIAPLSISNWT